MYFKLFNKKVYTNKIIASLHIFPNILFTNNQFEDNYFKHLLHAVVKEKGGKIASRGNYIKVGLQHRQKNHSGHVSNNADSLAKTIVASMTPSIFNHLKK